MSKASRLKRALKWEGFVSSASQIFHDKDILVERPFEMEFEEYRILRRIQAEVLKRVIHRAGPKTYQKRFKYSRKKLINALNEASDSKNIRREVSQHGEENNSQNDVQRKQGNVSRRGGRKKSG